MTDPFLEVLIKISSEVSNESNGEKGQGLTVQIGGLLVSGTVMSGKQYRRHEKTIEAIVDAIEEAKAKLGQPKETAEGPLVYLHLKDVAFFSPGSSQQIEAPFWRCRIEDISGFCLGRLTVSAAS